jgi:hypothetical protein
MFIIGKPQMGDIPQMQGQTLAIWYLLMKEGVFVSFVTNHSTSSCALVTIGKLLMSKGASS